MEAILIVKIKTDILALELAKIGIHKESYHLILAKKEIIPLKIKEVRTPAANIIKQEMLAAGGDCAVHAQCVTGKIDYTDILLLGTEKHYKVFIKKISQMRRCFGLDKICLEMENFLQLSIKQTTLADGRTISYPATKIMGIINVTPDSFYAPSRKNSKVEILKKVEQMLLDGATIIDLGAESSRPGATPVSSTEEQELLLPAIESIKQHFPTTILSVDTYKAVTADRAVAAGADIINDISGLADPQMMEVVLRNNVPIVIMHMVGKPATMQKNIPEYQDVVDDVLEFLSKQTNTLLEQGLSPEKIILDVGFGFSKSYQDNLLLLKRINEFTSLQYPVLLGTSRKSTIGKILGDASPEERLFGTIATTCHSFNEKVELVRVHDVKENMEAIKMLMAIQQ